MSGFTIEKKINFQKTFYILFYETSPWILQKLNKSYHWKRAISWMGEHLGTPCAVGYFSRLRMIVESLSKLLKKAC